MQAWGSRTQSPELARLSQWDASNPLVLHTTLATPAKLATNRKYQYVVGGDAVELHQNLYACLRVGRLDRATAILERLCTAYQPSAPELVDAHNIYLQTLFELELKDPKAESMATVQEWFDVNMRYREIPPNAQTFVTLLRAAMNFLEESAQENAIVSFLAMAHEIHEGVVDDINHSPEFTDEEWHTLIRAQPDDFEEPPPVEQVQDMLLNAPAARRDLVDQGLSFDIAQKIKPVEQKGLGLDSLRHALSVFEDKQSLDYAHDVNAPPEVQEKAFAYARQVRMEQDGLDAAVKRWRAEDEKMQAIGIHGVVKSKPVQAIMYNWYTALVPLFKKHIKRAKEIMAAPTPENSSDPAHAYGPWLERCKPEMLAAITISRVVAVGLAGDRDRSGSNYKVAGLSVTIATELQDFLHADAQTRRDNFIRKQRKELRKYLAGRLNKSEASQDEQSRPEAIAAPVEKHIIPLDVKTKIGALAIELLMQSATISVSANDAKSGKEVTTNQAAFYHQVRFDRGRKVGFIVPHPLFIEKLHSDSLSHVDPVRLPMIVEPKPWSSFADGGYYTIPQRVVRQKAGDPGQRSYAEAAIDSGDMNKVLAGLDVLGKVPWQINAPVFAVMAEAWNTNDSIGGLVSEDVGMERPQEPPADCTYQERVRWGKKLQEFENAKAGIHSQRCFQNFQLETARAFLHEKRIYFPHSVDFRGRAYPIPPTLNHIGSDVARGLLKFANGKELGIVGLQWLKIHLANLYGFDKASLQEREQFCTTNIDDVFDSATNPLHGRRWWTKAEDPWQTLACCIELKNALESPDPTRYRSQLPVHQDGTCNGLQHYAALGGDHAGARQVNLEPSDRPQDIYTGVAEVVKEMVAKDAENKLPEAEIVNGRITRKVVKRTVMTNVYGVTFIGAKMQVEDELRVMFPNFKETSKVRFLGQVAFYVALKIFEALGQIFNGAQEIQYWLGECGERITTSLSADQVKKIGERYEGKQASYDAKFQTPKKVTKLEAAKIEKSVQTFMTSIIWTTPLKMPVVQPYRKEALQKVKTKLQDITVHKRSATDPVDKRRQLQAFPPNFIHSLDASHMTLSALKCSELGLDFAAVHDSFWTHASDIPNLNVILRDAFVRMHSEDIIGRLSEEFKARYAGAMYLAEISSGSIAGIKIRQWRINYYRATGRAMRDDCDAKRGRGTIEEVALEAKRQRLLKSDDPEEVKEGEAMVTPTSIWLDHQDPKALMSSRLGLLGETKTKTQDNDAVYNSARDKVLDREAATIAQEKGQSNTTTTVDDATQDESMFSDEAANTKPFLSKQGGAHAYISAWIPLSFPPTPQKGSWDVSRLRESKYFFS
jgi:DNA-directed RNA polymerase